MSDRDLVWISIAMLAIRDLRCAIDNLDNKGGREHADKVLVKTAAIQAKLEKERAKILKETP